MGKGAGKLTPDEPLLPDDPLLPDEALVAPLPEVEPLSLPEFDDDALELLDELLLDAEDDELELEDEPVELDEPLLELDADVVVELLDDPLEPAIDVLALLLLVPVAVTPVVPEDALEVVELEPHPAAANATANKPIRIRSITSPG